MKNRKGEEMRDMETSLRLGYKDTFLRVFSIILVLSLGCLHLNAADLKSATKPGQSLTLLPDGHVLLLGGTDGNSSPSSLAYLADTSGKVVALPQLHVARAGHTATLLPDGTVFIFGGIGADGQVVQAAELFDPASRTLSALADVLAVPRAYHTATVLTDGTVLLAGGVMSGGQFPDDVQLWDFRTRHALSFHALLMNPRQGHTATLMADGAVRISGGTDSFARPVLVDEIYDPVTKRFRFTQADTELDQEPGAITPRIMASIPEDGANGVAIDQAISVRFSRLLQISSVNTNTFTLVGPDQQPIASSVTPVENGRLVFVLALAPLQSGTNYTLRIRQVTDTTGAPLPDTSISFQTAGERSDANGDDAGPNSPVATTQWQQLRPLQAAPNVTALAGQVLKLSGWPLAHVTLEIDGGPKTHTDSTGRFLLEGVTPGHHVLWIDGSTANHDKTAYGVYEVGATVLANKTNVLNYTIWMTPLDTAHTVNIASPTLTETVITNPNLPGLELHIPVGTVITDRHGKVVRKISVTGIPLNQPPFPLPAGVEVPVYLTVQPGGSYVKVLNPGSGPKGARLVYPNTWNFSPGTPFDFWDYDADVKGWFIYGQGHVTPDGRSITPNPGVVIYEFTGAMDGSPLTAPVTGPPFGLPKAKAGEPVDLSTGKFTYSKTDLSLSDVIPVTFTRTYSANDSRSRAFGIGGMHNYDIFTIGDTNPWTYQELILPDGGRVRFDRISPGTSWLDAVYVSTTSEGAFYGARMSWVISNDPGGGHWKLALKDGSSMTFPEAFQSTNPFCQAVNGITDRYGNTLLLQRSGCLLVKITSPNGRYISLTNDSQGRVTQAQDNMGRTVNYVYDAAGRLSTVTDVNGGVTTYTYDDQNRVLTIQDARGIVYLTNQYDSAGRVIQQTQADNSTFLFNWTPANAAQTHFYVSSGGGSGGGGSALVISGCWQPAGFTRSRSDCQEGYMPLVAQVDVTDPRGFIRRTKFGATGYMSSDTYALGQPEEQTVTYTYFPDNLVQSVTDALGRVTSFDYDGNGNTTRITRLAGTPNAVTTTFTYEPKFNHLASVTDPLGHSSSFSYDGNGNLITATDALNHQSTLGYNNFGQAVSATDALGNTMQFNYVGGDMVGMTDPLGNVSASTFDAAGRRIAATDPQGNTSRYQYNNLNLMTQVTDPMNQNTLFNYDPNGNLLSLTDALNHTTSYTYDNMDRALTRTDPLLRAEHYSYDLNGNLVSSTDRKNQVTSMTYDPLDRLKLVGYNTVVNGGNTTYESTISYTYDAGNRMTQAVDTAGGTITEVYDNLDRLTSETTVQGSISYGYDNLGRRTSMTLTGQPQVTYGYDNANRLTQIAQGSSTVGFVYDNVNRRSTLTMGNGVNVSYTYDNDSRVTGITYKFNNNTLGNFVYSYDELGRRTLVNGSFARTALPAAVSSASYDAGNELTNWNGTSISYDYNGNMLTDGSNAFAWNARNQVAKLNGISLQYDAAGRRTKNAAGTSFLYNGSNAAQELSGTTVTANLLSGGVDEVFTRADSSASFTPLTDALGSTIALVDAGGNIQTTYSYDPFGNTATAGAVSSNPSQYTGRENEGNGLYYYRARYYSPLLGRFVNEDPLGFAGSGPNVYSYTKNSPTNLTDPLGLESGDLDKLVPGPNGETSRKPLAGRKDFSWWGTFAKDFFKLSGGPGNVPTCAEHALGHIAEQFIPISPSGVSIIQAGAPVAQAMAINNSVTQTQAGIDVYIASRGLTVPLRSSVVRLMAAEGAETAVAVGARANLAVQTFAVDYAAVTSMFTTMDEAQSGTCAAAFPII